jgi:hypothetical protein
MSPSPGTEFPDVQATLEAAGVGGHFTVGSSKAEVVAAQGPPEAFSENVYQYGSSIVTFQNGAVVSWRQGHPQLKARLPFEDVAAKIGVFTIGSRKDEVIALQGKPDSASTGLFQYGSSVVFFREGRVVDWREGSPLLKARRPLDLVAANIGYFTVGSRRDEVMAVQGKPDRTTADAYYYGSAIVMFAGDRVISWRDGAPGLRARAR